MLFTIRYSFFILGILFLNACSNAGGFHTPTSAISVSPITPQVLSGELSHQHTNLSSKLQQFFQEWKGTKYKYGGTSKRGIDCSSLTQTAYYQTYGIRLPRTTTGQKKLGIKITKADLKVGDLVFFRKNRHVGIYVGNNQFMHSSSSKGVIISSLNNIYWRKHFTQARRIDDLETINFVSQRTTKNELL